MSTRSLTIEVTTETYAALARRAADTQRSVADEVVHLAEKDLSGDQLSAELEAEIEALASADDAALESVVQFRLSEPDRQRLEELHARKGLKGLSADEEDEAAQLLARYERCLVLRANALALLKQRGHDVAPLLRT